MYTENSVSAAQKPPLSTKEKMIYDFLCSHFKKTGTVPTRADIAENFQFKSANSAQQYINQLELKGYLLNTGLKQGLKIAGSVNDVSEYSLSIKVPLLGKVAAGLAVESQQIDDEIDIPKSMIKDLNRNYFALKIRGLSMIEDGIMEDDIVLVEERNTANNGEIVVATINGESTVKRFQKRKSSIELIPANSTMEPIIVSENDDFQIRGVVRSLMRKF